MNSQLRQDLVSGDWIVIAPGRANLPGHLIKKAKIKRIKTPIKDCPFENPEKSGNKKPILIYKTTDYGLQTTAKTKKAVSRKLLAVGLDKWSVMVIENKYPAFTHKNICAQIGENGPYSVMEGVGHHDLVITRSHNANFAHLDKHSAFLVFKAFQERYLMLAKDSCLAYVSIFHNWGPKAGASVYHPHYQIVAIPVVPPDVEHSLLGAARYFHKHKKCVHCAMIEYEKKTGRRVIYENKEAIAFAPFVSREPFELRIFPKSHQPRFESSSDKNLEFIADALQKSLLKIEKKLGDPDYNFFIHTAPLTGKKEYKHYHWHIEIQPKISISAGFELGTGIEITVVDPDEAAKILRS